MNRLKIKSRPGKGQLVLIFFIFFSGIYILLKTFVYPPGNNTISYTDNNFYVLDLSIPANLDFCGEKIPANNFEIKDDLKREFFSSSYWKSNSLALFKKAQRWFPYIEPILKEEGVPDDFKYLAVIESHLTNSSSPAGAAGFWQLVPGSARNYGLEVNAQVDERYHVEKSTHAACKHIKDAYKVFKNWTLSAAAYNLGIGGIIHALKRQNTDNYFDLLLNRETGSFVYRILAYKTLFSSPGHFGIKKKKWSYFSKIPFSVYKIDSTITSLGSFATAIGSSPSVIKEFNPWLLGDAINNPEKKTYEIRIPKNKTADYSGYVADLGKEAGYAVSPSQVVNVPEVKSDSIPALTSTATVENPPVQKTTYHVMKVNETIKELAMFYNVKEEELRKWNDLRDHELPARGQVLVIHNQVKK